VAASVFEAYLSGQAARFYDTHFADAAARVAAARRAARPLDARVAEALRVQNARFVASPAREANIDALAAGAAAVVTGQQVGLFLGPLFNFYKAATAIAAAREMARESGTAVVPVFWLQSEDHDLPEIAEVHAPAARPQRLSLPTSAENRVSLAHLSLPGEVRQCLSHLADLVEGLPHAAEHVDLLQRHYAAGQRWVAAFAGALAELFAHEGLVLIDSREPALAELAAPVHRRAIEDAGRIAAMLGQRTRELEEAGFAATVHVRQGSPLSFFHPHGPDGPRYRLEPRSDGYCQVGGHGEHTRAELLSTLDRDPMRFSTSALQRPIVQDTLLPTAAYVGGPGEVAYFAQLAPLYRAHGMSMPMVIPRARMRLVEDRTRRVLSRLGLTPAQASCSEDDLLAAAMPAGARVNPAAELLARFDAALASCRAAIEAEGGGLGEAVTKTHASVERSLLRLAEKIERARLHHDQALVEDVRRLHTWLQPNGQPQERVYGISYFAARYGQRRVIDAVLAAQRPFDATPLDVDLHEDAPAPAAAVAR